MIKNAKICYVELPKTKKEYLKGKTPCMIIEEMRDGSYTPYVTAIPITDKKRRYNPNAFHYKLRMQKKECYLLINQIQIVDRNAIKSKPIATIPEEELIAIYNWLKAQLNLI